MAVDVNEGLRFCWFPLSFQHELDRLLPHAACPGMIACDGHSQQSYEYERRHVAVTVTVRVCTCGRIGRSYHTQRMVRSKVLFV